MWKYEYIELLSFLVLDKYIYQIVCTTHCTISLDVWKESILRTKNSQLPFVLTREHRRIIFKGLKGSLLRHFWGPIRPLQYEYLVRGFEMKTKSPHGHTAPSCNAKFITLRYSYKRLLGIGASPFCLYQFPQVCR